MTGKRVEDGRCLVDIEFRATNQRDVVTAPASATVALPSREHGPVRLPDPPADLQQNAIEMMNTAALIGLSQSRCMKKSSTKLDLTDAISNVIQMFKADLILVLW